MLFKAVFGAIISVTSALQGFQAMNWDQFQEELARPVQLEMRTFNLKDAPDVDGAFEREAKHDVDLFRNEEGKFEKELREIKQEEQREEEGLVPNTHFVPKLRKIEV